MEQQIENLICERDALLEQLNKIYEEEKKMASQASVDNRSIMKELQDLRTQGDDQLRVIEDLKRENARLEAALDYQEHEESSLLSGTPDVHIERKVSVPQGEKAVKWFHPIIHPDLDPNCCAYGPYDIDAPTVNDWSPETEATARKWQRDIEKSSFVYGELLANNDHRMQQVLVTTLMLSALMTLLAALSAALGALQPATLGISAAGLKWTVFTFSVLIALSASMVMLGNGIMTIYGWDSNVKNLTKFVQRLDSEWFVFETELNIPKNQRQNGIDFIKRADGNYMHLMQQCPPISGDDYVNANQKYQERLFDNFVWQQKFKQRIENELKPKKQDPSEIV